jgi:hypothetical protein
MGAIVAAIQEDGELADNASEQVGAHLGHGIICCSFVYPSCFSFYDVNFHMMYALVLAGSRGLCACARADHAHQ